jgi:hypothetical protein
MENFKRATMLIMDIESNWINQVNLNNSWAYGYFQIKNNNWTWPDWWQNSTIHTTLKLIKELYNKKNIWTPDWILKINKNTDIIKLESDEQTILFMFYIFTRANYTKWEVTENIFDVLIWNWGTIRKWAMRNLYWNHHHTNMKNHPPTEKLFVKKSKFHIPSFEFYKWQFEIKK